MIKLIFSLTLTVLLAGAGTSMVAEAAKPGDLLYPVKTGINEKVRGWLVTEYVANVGFQIDLLEERLKEIESLINENELTPDIAVKAQAEIVAQVNSTNQALNSASAAGLTASQKNQLSITASRLKKALLKYQTYLATMDKEAKKSKRHSGSGDAVAQSTATVVGDVVVDIATEADVVVDLSGLDEDQSNPDEGELPQSDEDQTYSTYRFECPAGESFTITYEDGTDNATLVIETDMAYQVTQAISGSGARYESDNGATVFWEHQGEASVEIDGETKYEGCTLADPDEEVDDSGVGAESTTTIETELSI